MSNRATSRATAGAIPCVFIALAFVGAVSVPSAQAGRLFLSQLDGAQEVPPVPSPGTGEAVTYLHSDGTMARMVLTVEGLVNPIVAAHIHIGAPGTNGPMLYNLGAFTDSLEKDFGPISPGLLETFLTGGFYVNVHTNVYLDGEIRGQLVPQAARSFTASLDGAQEVPPSGSAGTGLADLTLWPDGSRLHLDLRVENLGGAITASHIHRAPPGENGPVVFPIGAFEARVVRDFTPAPDQVQDLLAGLYYVNVHTASFPGGEIRGQIGENTPASVPTSTAMRPRPALSAAPNPTREGVTLWWTRAPGTSDRISAGAPGLVSAVSADFRVEILDASGRRVRGFVAEGASGAAIPWAVRWDGRVDSGSRAPAGVYFARLSLGAESAVVPVTVIR